MDTVNEQTAMAAAVNATTPPQQVSVGSVLARRAVDIELDDLTAEESNAKRIARIRAVVEAAVSKHYKSMAPYLDRFGADSGSVNFAHCQAALEVKHVAEAELTVIGRESQQTVMLTEVWKLIHEYLKRRGVVFSKGWVDGVRSDHIIQ